MSWWRRVFGMDGFDLGLQVVVTGVLMFWIGETNNSRDATIWNSMIMVASLVVLGVRRRVGLRSSSELQSGEVAALRIAELEARLGELEEDRARLLELEERVDFAERLLASQREPMKELAK